MALNTNRVVSCIFTSKMYTHSMGSVSGKSVLQPKRRHRMDLKPYLGPTLAALFICAASPVLAQVVPAATQGNIPLSVGGGISAFNPDDGHGHILGGTLWIDYTLPHMPHNLQGIGIEAEGRDLNYGRSGSLLPGVRQDVALGGVIYSWPRLRQVSDGIRQRRRGDHSRHTSCALD
jgi:hypothetical protein